MLNVILHQPEIPPNTGNLIRLCANSGASLHLIEPLGFSMHEKALRRAGLDYHETARVSLWPSLDACWEHLGVSASHTADQQESPGSGLQVPCEGTAATLPAADRPRIWAATTRGSMPHTAARFRQHDILLFGAESRGLPDEVLADPRIEARLRVPMRPGSRSLNLSNSVSIMLYEAWRQLGFEGASLP